jgi:glycerophosphoryl diester phosphodiesterase
MQRPVYPAVVASECGAALYPQNSLGGFRHCLDMNVDGIEFDVHLSRDGEVVVQHDYRLNKRITRQVNGDWLKNTGPALCELTLAELAQYDIGRYQPGSYEEKSYPNYQPVDGERIPTLKQLLNAYQDHPNSPTLWIELKTSPFQREISADPASLLENVMAQVQRLNLSQQCVLLAFEWDLLVAAKTQYPTIQTDFLTINPAYIQSSLKLQPETDPFSLYGKFNPADFSEDYASAIVAAGGDWWGPLINDVSVEDVARAQAMNLKVNLWGVESTPAGIEHALAYRAEALTLSDPGILQRSLLRFGVRVKGQSKRP